MFKAAVRPSSTGQRINVDIISRLKVDIILDTIWRQKDLRDLLKRIDKIRLETAGCGAT